MDSKMIKNDMQKVVLIIGVSSGFGKAIAERLLAQGHIVQRDRKSVV